MSKSEIKLFLSVDIAGSTKLKNSHNYTNILKRCEEDVLIANKILTKSSQTTKEEVFKNNRDSIFYQDWSSIIKELFSDFNTDFCKFLEYEQIYPWKFAGDELIYCIPVKSKMDVYKYVLAFYQTLRSNDKKCKGANLIRLKGAAWTAGFPVRNRIIETPIPKLYEKTENENYIDYPYPHIDYVGPEMDIGFRIGKHTYPGFIVVSLELAYILAGIYSKEAPAEDFEIVNVGWEVLKGVWEEKKYPIFWLQLPQKYNETTEFFYKVYNFWDREENSLLKEFEKSKKDLSLHFSKEEIEQIIEELKEKYSITKPYFCDDGDNIPKEHQKLIDFMNFISSLDEIDLSEENNLDAVNNDNLSTITSIITSNSVEKKENCEEEKSIEQ